MSIFCSLQAGKVVDLKKISASAGKSKNCQLDAEVKHRFLSYFMPHVSSCLLGIEFCTEIRRL